MQAKVFVVEDEGLIALELQASLEREGFAVDGIADNAQQALDEIAACWPDIALVDIRIKGDRDGVWLAGEIRQRFNIPVVFVTAYADDATLQRARATEPYLFLVKPFFNINFRAQLRTAMWKHAADSLVRSERSWLASTLNQVAGGVLRTDAQGKVTYMNEEAERMTGFGIGDARGQLLEEVLPLHDIVTGKSLPSPILQLRRGVDPSPETMMCHLLSERAQEGLIAEVNIAVNRDDVGLVGLVVSFRDVTSHREKHLRQRDQERLETVGALAAGLGGDLSTLLRTLDEQAKRLCEVAPKELRQLAEATRAAGQEALILVAQLSELERTDLPFRECVNLNQILIEAVEDPGMGILDCKLDLAEGGAMVETHGESCLRNVGRAVRIVHNGMAKGGRLRISTWASESEVLVCIRNGLRQTRLPSPSKGVRGVLLTLVNHYMALTRGKVDHSGDGPDESPVIVLHFPKAEADMRALTRQAASQAS